MVAAKNLVLCKKVQSIKIEIVNAAMTKVAKGIKIYELEQPRLPLLLL